MVVVDTLRDIYKPVVALVVVDAVTGNKEINDRLSKARAEAVYDCLVNEFGVNPNQLRVDYKGGVDNMFYDDPALSRAVITRANY